MRGKALVGHRALGVQRQAFHVVLALVRVRGDVALGADRQVRDARRRAVHLGIETG